MDASPDRDTIDGALRHPLRVMQTIHGAMVAGIVAYFALVAGMRYARPPLAEGASPPGDSTLLTMAVLSAAAAVVASVILPPAVARGIAPNDPLGPPPAGSGPVSPSILLAPLTYRLCLVLRSVLDGSTGLLDPAMRGTVLAWQRSRIVGTALIEAAAFFAVFVLSAGNVPGWFVAVPIGLILFQAWRFPTLAGLVRWIDARRAEIETGLLG